MPTRQVNLRLGDETIQYLDYLCAISHRSQASVVADLVTAYYHAITVEAFGTKAPKDKDLIYNGGTIITVEEQRALSTVRGRLNA